MAIQAQLYPTITGSPYGYCAGGLIDSHFNSQHRHHHQQQQSEQHHLRELYNGWQGPIEPNLHVYNSKALNLNSPILALQLEKQWEEVDRYISFQNEKLIHTLQEHGKQQVAALLKKVESRSLHILREKDEEIAQAAKRRVELEENLRKLEAENRKWQRVAQEKETMAITLYKTLEDMKESGYCFNNGTVANDAVSYCDEKRDMEEQEEEGTAENRVECERVGEIEQITRGMMLCKSCHSRRSCFLFLPCRHLSSCKVCNAFLEACPVCRMPKKASIETFIDFLG